MTQIVCGVQINRIMGLRRGFAAAFRDMKTFDAADLTVIDPWTRIG